ncbi:hypothetical protein SDC9_192464 [bioreactor metagenome]|uniref:Uncharacterized protein n=1 Tax=bioreactor metagenome TaxID=1076179 RepID=A0A645I0U5_9ZZZZ
MIANGVRVNNSIFPKECTRNGKISAIAKAAPWIKEYTIYKGIAANINMNSSGSVTPVKKTANAAEKYIDLYFERLSASTLRYIAKAKPIKIPDEPIICPTLKRAGVQFSNTKAYCDVSPAPLRLTKSVAQASHNGS